MQRLFDRREIVSDAASSVTAPQGVAEAPALAVDFSRQPLWAYGFTEPPKPGEGRPTSRADA